MNSRCDKEPKKVGRPPVGHLVDDPYQYDLTVGNTDGVSGATTLRTFILATLSICLIAQSLSAQTKEGGAHCALYTSEERFDAYINEDELRQRMDISTFNTLFKAARQSLWHDKMITVDIKACIHESFANMGIGCDKDEKKSAWVGYNHRFLHPTIDSTWVTTWGEQTDVPPDSYGTLLGKYLYEADVWLKETMFSELIPSWNKVQQIPQEASISIYFEPNIQSSMTRVLGDVYWTIEKTDIRIVGDGPDPTAIEFVNKLKDDPQTRREEPINNLMTIFKIAFLADKANQCPVLELSRDHEVPAKTSHPIEGTPTSHPIREGTLEFGRESYTLYGGVRIDSSFFEASETHSDGEIESIEDILNTVPQDATEWRVEVEDTAYVGITLYE